MCTYGDLPDSKDWVVRVMGPTFLLRAEPYSGRVIRIVQFNPGVEVFANEYVDLYGYRNPYLFYKWYGVK